MHEPVRRRAAVIRHVGMWVIAGTISIGMVAVTAPAAMAASKGASSKSSKSSQAKAFSAFQACLAKHGVKLPNGRSAAGGARRFPGGGYPGYFSGGNRPPSGSPPAGGYFHGGGFPGGGSQKSNSKQAKAFAACRSKLPKGGFAGQFRRGQGGGNFKPTPAQQQALNTLTQCLSSHGVKVSSTTNFEQIRQLMAADPTAAKACQSDLKGLFGPPPRSSSSSSSNSTTT